MKVDQEVMKVLSMAVVEGNTVKLTMQLERKLYERTNKVLEAAGGKWNRKAKAHVFSRDAESEIDQILLTGEITVPQDFGYYPTPELIVRRMVKMAQIEPGMEVLEPSAGTGAIAAEVARTATVDCVELLEKNVEVMKAGGYARHVIQGDFLQMDPRAKYDRVVMNPPFEKQADIKHVMHAHQFLKPGGLLVSVMSAGVLFRGNRLTLEFKLAVDEVAGEIYENPTGAFKESGTMVNTVIAIMPSID